tara:strand:- start:13942 stop:14580 length:639 start_codon:yes stop_codon:yes gene_type:complete
VGDDPAAVEANRQWLAALLPPPGAIQWLEQVHGIDVVRASADGDVPAADASWTDQPGLACAVLTADCLPVLLSSVTGDVVAAAHAGWRGLAAGILEQTVFAMPARPCEMLAWLGPAIGPSMFEVGAEVREQFIQQAGLAPRETAACFVPVVARPDHFLADIYTLARLRLASTGVTRVFGGGYCTVTEAKQFYSYRRDGQTGRMASLISINPG